MNKEADTTFTVDFVGIGAAKSGTTWLVDQLKRHPEVCISIPKEISYFNNFSSEAAGFAKGKPRGKFRNPNFYRSNDWYARHFHHCPKNLIKGEFSPIYMSEPEVALRIKARFTETKLLVCLRNPIDRAYSAYWSYREFFKVEHEPFEKVIEKENPYLEQSLYYARLKPFFDHFPADQIHIIFFDDILSDPQYVFSELCRFLDINDSIPIHNPGRPRNPAQKIKNIFLLGLMESIPRTMVAMGLSKWVEGMRNTGLTRVLMRLNSSAYSYPAMAPDVRDRLKDYFANDLENLTTLIGPLPDWA